MNYIIISICHKLILIGSLLNGVHGISNNVMYLVKQTNLTDEPTYTSISLMPADENNVTEVNKNFDFIIKLQFILNEQKIIPFLRNEIYNDYSRHNITTEDLIELWKLRSYTLKDLSSSLSIPTSLFNSNDLRRILHIGNITFIQYYTDLKGNISRSELQETLKTLEINPVTFSGAITYGTEDEIYEVLSTGKYTWDTFEEVKNKSGLDIPELTKNIILNQLSHQSINELIADFQNFPMVNRDMYDRIWDKLNITTMDVYKVESLRRIVDNIYEHLTENTTFGVAISKNDIILHRTILDNLNKIGDIVTIYGETSTSHLIYDNLIFSKGISKNSVRLWTNNSLSSTIDVMTRMGNESTLNCSYISNVLTEHNVTLLNVTEHNISAILDEQVIFNVGNPLICNGNLTGLAVTYNKDDNVFVFDAFFQPIEVVSDGSLSVGQHSFMLLFSICVLLLNCLRT